MGSTREQEIEIYTLISQTYFNIQNYQEAINRANFVLEKFKTIPDILMLRPYIILMKASLKLAIYPKIPTYYEEAILIIYFILGYHHPI